MQSKAVVVLLILSAVSLTLGDYCMPIINAANSVCGTLPATTCTPTATSVDGSTYSVANYDAVVQTWRGQKSALCPLNPGLVDDYPLQRYCPDACTSNYTCDANKYTNFNTAPMCYSLCLRCFDQTQCNAWANTGNVTKSGVVTGCYASWTHMGADTLQVNDVSPTWGYLKGNQKIVITGCGFTTYSEATCVWGNWHSTNAIIVDDNTIHCWTPKVSFVTVPTTTSFNIIFDGTPAIIRKLPDFWWGPMITAISPTQVYVTPTTSLTISGFGFSEYNGTVVVMIDGATCTSPSVSDSTISCTLPSGSINQNAIVDVYFSGWKYYFAHTHPWTLHYGPIVTGINPTCGSVNGGTTVTITGSLFDDPVLNTPRVEFTIGGNIWLGVNPAHTGSTITVQTPLPWNGMAMFDQNAAIVVFGSSPSNAKVPGTAAFHYGALLFSVTPTVGYVDGGETISVTGCAFKDYNNTQYTGLFQDTSNTALCTAGSLNVVNDNLITCTSVTSQSQCFVQKSVYLGLPGALGLIPNANQAASTYTNKWWWGPWLNTPSLTPNRGPWSVQSSATLTGYKIGRSTNTLFNNNVCNFNVATATPANGTITNGQTTFACVVPANAWNIDGTVNYYFDAPCQNNYPTSSPYHWGPRCTGVTPTFGYLGGLQTVTLQGVGFQDADWNGKILKPTFCVSGVGAGCNWEQYGTAVTVTSTNAATTTTPNFSLAPRNGFGANRYFGNSATVTLFFDTTKNETQSLTCGTYRYGPIVTATTPRKGPIGPRAPSSPNTPVAVAGVGFADPLLTNNIRVAFGGIHGEGASTAGDTAINVKTLWGARANTDKNVYVYFDTCNTTVSTTSWTWGPQVFNVTPIWGFNAGMPNGTNTVVTIQGARFGEWKYGTSGYTDAVCVIDNVYGTNTVIVDDNTITCTVPARPFGTQAVVQVVFGKTCRGDWDWSQVVQSPNDIWYRPTISGIAPTVGYTSGNVLVTISGLGLGGWDNYYCFFGHYQGTMVTKPTNLNDPVVCRTPVKRQDFNTDVLVHVQLVSDTTIPPASQGFDFKVWGPTYHYGPLCQSVTPSRGYLNPDNTFSVTLGGVGFSDSTFFNNTTPYVLFNAINVTVSNPSDSAVVVNGILPDSCLNNKTITMWWDKPTQVISCPPFTHGPVILSSTPDLGWQGDQVTITGSLFADPQLYTQPTNVQVMFGTAQGTTMSVTDGQIVVTAPANAWLFDPTLVVRWSGANKTCINDAVLKANDFHYGPIIDSITPTFGFVYGRTPVTINGKGFQCCGLDTSKTLCRFGKVDTTLQDGTTATQSQTQITCNSLGRGAPEITGSTNAVTDKIVGLRFNDTTQNRIIDTDTVGLPRQSPVWYHYGPLIKVVTPTYGRIRGGTPITITGAGFSDPFLTNPTLGNPNPACKFTPQSGGAGPWMYNATAWSDASITCQTLDYIHKCGDPLDVITLVFYVNTSTTDRFNFPSSSNLTHFYGPLVSSITPSWGYVKGGDTVTINAAEMDEWTGRQAKVLFANREINDQQYAISGNQFVVTSPPGSFLHSGPISVILDYKNDALTTLKYYWHWHPFTTTISQGWGIEGGGFSTTVYGGGFCEYETVQCKFGATLGSQSDVAYDDRVVCSVPANAPGSVGVSLTFCDYWADCQCSYANSADTIQAPSFNHVGITGVSPVSGPWVGNTLVTITGSGFDIFSSISVSFGSLTAVAPVGNGTSATSFTVMTPAAPSAMSVQIFITLTYTFSTGDTQTFTIPDRSETPFNFHYGYPAITSTAPATTDVDTAVDVTLTGDYFNGGLLSNIKCYWTVPAATGTTTLTVAAKSKTDTTVTCTSPAYTTGVLIHGPSTLSLSYDGNRRSNIVGFVYTQNPTISSIFPTNGPQYGGILVTVTGANFNAAISVLCKFNGVISGSSGVNVVTTTTTTTTAAATTAATTTGAPVNTTTTTTTTTGAANGTTTGKGPAVYNSRKARGLADTIVCNVPRSLASTFPANAPVEISLDGGLTWTATASNNVFQYQEGFTSTSENSVGSTSASSVMVPLVSLVFALVLFVVVF